MTGTENEYNTMEIWTPILGDGGLTVATDGVLDVHRHVVLYGPLTLYAGSVVNVDQETLFSVDDLEATDCPQ